MGYKITYCSFGEEKKQPKQKQAWKRFTAVGLVMMLVLGALAVKHTELPWVQKYLLPGDPAVTAAALEGMLADLKDGDSLKDAVTAFCREIVEHAENG